MQKKAMWVFGIKLMKMSVQLVEIPGANSWGQCKGYIKTNTNLNAELNISYTILLLRQYNHAVTVVPFPPVWFYLVEKNEV